MTLAAEADRLHPPIEETLGRAIVPLLALAVLINYVDRANLANAAPLIKGELHLSAGQIGLLISAFFWTYVPAQILAAWLVGQAVAGPRVAGKRVGPQNCVGNLAGSVAPLVTGLVVDRSGEYFWAFIIAAVFALIGFFGWVFVVRRVAPLDWSAGLGRARD